MKIFPLALVLLLPAAIAAAQPAAPDYIPGDQADKTFHDTKSPVTAVTVALPKPSQTLQEQLIVRNASGQVETHANWIDHIVILEGEGTMTVGGKVSGDKESAPGERRGESSTGGKPYRLTPHTVLHIAAGTPHWLTLPPGGHIAYVVFKEKN